MSAATDAAVPPEGSTNFSNIPTAQFVEDVDKHMKGEDTAEEKLKVNNRKQDFMGTSLAYLR